MARLERLQKVLAHAGIASRRASEKLIIEGRVRVNGKIVTELGTKVDPMSDKVEVDGKRVHFEDRVYIILHKPRAVMCTLDDPEGRDTIRQCLKQVKERVYPVGRLDYHTSGAILMTNDGDLTEALLRPVSGVPKVYIAKMDGHLDVPELDALRKGVTLDDGYTTKKAELFVERTEEQHTWLQITLTEGKNRQIHRMGDAINHRVLRLARLSFAGITTENLRPGQWRQLSTKEVDKLKKKYVVPYKRRQKIAAEKAKQQSGR